MATEMITKTRQNVLAEHFTKDSLTELRERLNVARSTLYVTIQALENGDGKNDLDYLSAGALKGPYEVVENLYDDLIGLVNDMPDDEPEAVPPAATDAQVTPIRRSRVFGDPPPGEMEQFYKIFNAMRTQIDGLRCVELALQSSGIADQDEDLASARSQLGEARKTLSGLHDDLEDWHMRRDGAQP